MPTPEVETLREFYSAMHGTIEVRRRLVTDVVEGRPPDPEGVGHLRVVRDALRAIPCTPDGRRLARSDGRSIHVDLAYELDELDKDLAFLAHGDEAVLDLLRERRPDADDERSELVAALDDVDLRTFVTDRDGTVNNYCGRYASSVQSVWNAVFLTRFERSRVERALVLTSAPLDDIGIADLTVTAPGTFVVAGSKGREYVDEAGRRRRYPIDDDRQRRLDELNDGLDDLLGRPGRSVFTLIGSGRQHKFGQTTIAYQDVTDSVPDDRAAEFREEVTSLVREIDPDRSYFRIEDTGLDLELVLTVDDTSDGPSRDFDKGDGLRFLDADIPLGMDRGASLVCGDTASDETMMIASAELAPQVRTVYVTANRQRRAEVSAAVGDTLFASEPDVLVAALNDLAGR
ncbi:trehalose 6-phosphate synthase [Ilumatobacter sp.]|uniref:trehalose 6-phosphate synthase n=1 Tax=Ilumatobacter sp. TaxID=1967498 RepID=UPI003B52642D